MKPWMQFYPGDWQRDAALRSCSVGARGLWIEMICLMHQAEPYGHLVINGKPIAVEALARMVGCTPAECRKWLAELTDAGVLSRDGDVIFSRRMVKDERNRKVRADGGKLGGNPALMDKGKVNHMDNHKVNHPPNLEPSEEDNDGSTIGLTPSEVRSQKSEEPPPTPPKSGGGCPDSVPDPPPGFDAFWAAWPSHKRKADKLRCLRKWIADGCEPAAELIVGKVRAWAASEDWTKGGGEFVPAPLVWLNRRAYDAPPPTNSTPEGVTYVNGQARIGRFVA